MNSIKECKMQCGNAYQDIISKNKMNLMIMNLSVEEKCQQINCL